MFKIFRKYLAWRADNANACSLNMRQAYQGGWVSWIPVVAQVGSSLLASNEQSNATQAAADTSANATNRATDLQKQMYDQTRTDQTPWRNAGANALSQLVAGTGANGEYIRPFGMADYTADPGYNFRLKEGQRAIDRSAAATGGLQSGAALKAAARYGQDYGSGEYQNAYNRFQSNQSNAYNRLASMAGLGQTANNALGAAGTNYANSAGNLGMTNAANVGNAQLMAGQARASSYQGIGNSLGRMFGGNTAGNFSQGNMASANGYYDPGAAYNFMSNG